MMMLHRSGQALVLVLAAAVALAGCGKAPEGQDAQANARGSAPVASGDLRAEVQKAVAKGAAHLRAIAKENRWQGDPQKPADLGITAMVTWSLLAAEGKSAAAGLADTLAWMASFQKDDGSIYDTGLASYITSASMMAFSATGDPKWQSQLERALQYLQRLQADEGEGRTESSEDYGGIGYNSGGEASGVVNLSTTHFALDAARASGLPVDQRFYTKALRFLERSQNRSESNPTQFKGTMDGAEVTVVSGNDGGGIYRPGESKAGLEKLSDGRIVFRSYGSMTYALLKSYILCKVDARDPRMEAALAWCAENFELGWNPGMEHVEGELARYQGLYYYYMTIGRALSAAEAQKVALPEALKDWRAKLARALLDRQREDGSWRNDKDRWAEGSSALCTAYALIALSDAFGVQP